MGDILQSIYNALNISVLLSQVKFIDIILKIIYIGVIIFITGLILKIRYNIITKAFQFAKLDEYKKQTLVSLLMSSTKYILFAIAIVFIITLFIPLKQLSPIIAGAGVLGLAIGFGAQNLVKDIITGFFIMFEDQFNVGDFVNINNSVTGTVEEMGLRITALREWSGKKFYIANSEILTVHNYNREEMRAIVRATFPYHESPEKIRTILEEVCEEIKSNYSEHLLRNKWGQFDEPPQIYGVLDINENERGGTFAITTKTVTTSVWTVEKTIKELIWQKCIENGVELAYPRRVLEGVHVDNVMYEEDNRSEKQQ